MAPPRPTARIAAESQQIGRGIKLEAQTAVYFRGVARAIARMRLAHVQSTARRAGLGPGIKLQKAAWGGKTGQIRPRGKAGLKPRNINNVFRWCARRDSNPHDFTHCHLKAARLPIPPRALGIPAGRMSACRINGADVTNQRWGDKAVLRPN